MTPTNIPAELSTTWRRHRELTGVFRADSAKLRQLRHSLGLQLAALRDRFVAAGEHGRFEPWLRAHRIPQSTAYRLMARARQSALPPPPPLRYAEMRGADLILPLTLRQAHIARRALDHLRGPRGPQVNLIQAITRAFLNSAHGFLRQQLDSCARNTRITLDTVAGLPLLSLPLIR